MFEFPQVCYENHSGLCWHLLKKSKLMCEWYLYMIMIRNIFVGQFQLIIYWKTQRKCYKRKVRFTIHERQIFKPKALFWHRCQMGSSFIILFFIFENASTSKIYWISFRKFPKEAHFMKNFCQSRSTLPKRWMSDLLKFVVSIIIYWWTSICLYAQLPGCSLIVEFRRFFLFYDVI